MDRLLFTTMPGLEAVSANELRDHDLRVDAAGRGLLVGRIASGSCAPLVRRLNRKLRCVQRVGVLIGRGRVVTLEDAGNWAAELDFAELFESPSTFAVRAERVGRHDFRRPDLERRVGSAVQESFERKGRRPPSVDLTDPDALLRVNLDEERIIAWLDTTGYRGLHVRAYRRYSHMASMRPTVANLLIRLAAPSNAGTLVDPFCGSATIPIEAALRARGVDPGAVRGEPWAWQRLEWLAADGERSGGEVSDRETDLAGMICEPEEGGTGFVGIERYSGHLQGGAENAALAGVLDSVRLVSGRAQQTDEILAELGGARTWPQPIVVVTNPPFGRRVGFSSETRNLYRAAAAAWRRAGVVRVATLAESRELMAESLEQAGYGVREMLPASYGAIDVTVFLAELA